jgi:hypothetical protein
VLGGPPLDLEALRAVIDAPAWIADDAFDPARHVLAAGDER